METARIRGFHSTKLDNGLMSNLPKAQLSSNGLDLTEPKQVDHDLV
jgi:hypothetical protein